MAEGLLKERLGQHPALRDIDVSSAGTIAYDGNLPSADAVEELLERYGIDISQHRARSVGRGIEADLVLTMDRVTTAETEALVSDQPVTMLGDFAGTGEEVQDPYGGPRVGYRIAAEQIARLVDAVVARLERGQDDEAGPEAD